VKNDKGTIAVTCSECLQTFPVPDALTGINEVECDFCSCRNRLKSSGAPCPVAGNKVVKTIQECKTLADEMLKLWDQASMLYLCLTLVGISEPHASGVIGR